MSHKYRRLGLGVLLVSAGILLAWLYGRYIPGPRTLADRLMGLGHWQEVVFLLGHILATAVAIPGTVLVVAGGVLFGVVWGTVWSVIGATLGAVVAFWIARHGLREWCRRRFQHRPLLTQIDRHLQRQDFWYVLAVRFAPVSPFNVINFVFGLTSVRLSSYALGTLLGIIPGTAAYTWVGSAGVTAVQQGEWWPLVLALLLLMGLSLLPVMIRHRSVLGGVSLRRPPRKPRR